MTVEVADGGILLLEMSVVDGGGNLSTCVEACSLEALALSAETILTTFDFVKSE